MSKIKEAAEAVRKSAFEKAREIVSQDIFNREDQELLYRVIDLARVYGEYFKHKQTREKLDNEIIRLYGEIYQIKSQGNFR